MEMTPKAAAELKRLIWARDAAREALKRADDRGPKVLRANYVAAEKALKEFQDKHPSVKWNNTHQ